MRVLVTGAAGFIGYHVCVALVDAGHEVVALDNLEKTYDSGLKLYRVELLGERSVTVRPDDIRRPLPADELGSVDAVVHLAARAGVQPSLRNPASYVRTNVEGTVNVLEYARSVGCERVVYASSSSVKTCLSPYAASKIGTDALARSYSAFAGMRTTGLRYHTVYGPLGRPDMAAWKFAERIYAGRSVKIFDQGRVERDFTFVDDAVAATLASLELDEPEGTHRVFDIGSGETREVRDLAEILREELNPELELRIELTNLPPGDQQSSSAELTAANELLGERSTTKLEKGLPRFARWWREWVDSGRARYSRVFDLSEFRDKASWRLDLLRLYEGKPYFQAYARHTAIRMEEDGPAGAVGHSEKWEDHGRWQLELLTSRVGLDLQSHRLLDLGCGTGRLSRVAVPELRVGGYVGIDVCPEAVTHAHGQVARGQYGLRGARFVVGDGTLSALEGEAFDVAWAFSVFTHCPPDAVQRVLCEMAELAPTFAFTFKRCETEPRRTGLKQFSYPPAWLVAEAEKAGFDQTAELEGLVWPGSQPVIVARRSS